MPGYGYLEVICGPMFAGKSTALLTRIAEREAATVLKPAYDTRYGLDQLCSHDGVCVPAQPVSCWPSLPAQATSVFVDEIQFFTAPNFTGDLAACVRETLERGIDVVCAGLDLDWRGRPFDVTAQLLAMADRVTKLTAVCSECGAPAGKTAKRAALDKRVDLGGRDLYAAACNRHWHQTMTGIPARHVS